jgi:transcriptional regulator with XRE-family HTH domain
MIKELGKKIRVARELKGLSQKKLGLILGLSDKAISSYESSRTYPPLDTLYQIAKELDKSMDFFITKDDGKLDIEVKLQSIEKKMDELRNSITDLITQVNKQ